MAAASWSGRSGATRGGSESGHGAVQQAIGALQPLAAAQLPRPALLPKDPQALPGPQGLFHPERRLHRRHRLLQAIQALLGPSCSPSWSCAFGAIPSSRSRAGTSKIPTVCSQTTDSNHSHSDQWHIIAKDPAQTCSSGPLKATLCL